MLEIFQKNLLMKALVITSSALAVVACDDNDNSNPPKLVDQQPVATMSKLAVSPTNLASLGDDYVYEGWLITPKGAVAAGRFKIDDSNPTATQTFTIDKAVAESATKYVLTIEPANETGAELTAPSSVHIIAGDIMNNTATATTSDGAALGTDFSSAMGKFILATPTDGDQKPTQGIWYIDNSTGQMVAGLTLPKLPTGWVYEGWIVDGTPMSTGTFNADDNGMVTMADSDGAGSTAGSKGSPAFPGQDYINPAKDLIGKTAVISVEPSPDNSAAPFSIKPLVGEIKATGGVMSLENKAAGSLPTASISIMAK